MTSYAIVFLAWGERHIREVESCVARSTGLEDYDLLLITDEATDLPLLTRPLTQVIRAPFKNEGLLRKTELLNFLPPSYAAFLFLDSDTVVLHDIHLGFIKAETFGIAAAPAPSYSLDHFWGFNRIMHTEAVPCKSQLQYNTGVLFFKPTPAVHDVFRRWGELAGRHRAQTQNDQPYFTLAMEQLDFNPYTLSIAYNYRGFGDALHGVVRIWHSRYTVPRHLNRIRRPDRPRRIWPLARVTMHKVVRTLKRWSKLNF